MIALVRLVVALALAWALAWAAVQPLEELGFAVGNLERLAGRMGEP